MAEKAKGPQISKILQAKRNFDKDQIEDVCLRAWIIWCCGNLPVLQVFGGTTRSSLLQEAHNSSTQFIKQQYNTTKITKEYLRLIHNFTELCAAFVDNGFGQIALNAPAPYFSVCKLNFW